jgi:penicillin-binding protein 1C
MNNPFYKPLPPFRQDCIGNNGNEMEFISPFANEQIYLPKDFNEQHSKLILKVKHSQPNVKIYWYLDEVYLTTTSHIHEYAILPQKGKHNITIVDEFGNEKQRIFKIL